MEEAEFIKGALEQYRAALSTLPEKFATAQRQSDRRVDLLCEEAGIMGKVQAEKDSLKTVQKQIQTQADLLQGRIGMLEELHRQFYLAPIPEGVTHMYGIELAPLDPETRLMVMHGQGSETWEETIRTLGGDPEDQTKEEGEKPFDLLTPPPAPVAAALPPPSPIEEMLSDVLDDEFDGPDEGDLDEIELSEIEARIESGEATQEDLVRASAMLSRAREAGA